LINQNSNKKIISLEKECNDYQKSAEGDSPTNENPVHIYDALKLGERIAKKRGLSL